MRTTGAGPTRRALGTINRNIIAPPPYACAVHKRGVLTEYEFRKPLFDVFSYINVLEILNS